MSSLQAVLSGIEYQPMLLALAVLAPWLVLGLLCLARTRVLVLVPARLHARALAGWLLPLAALPALLAAMLIGDGQWLVLLSGHSGIHFGLDGINRTFLLLSALLWMLSGWFARGWLDGHARRGRFIAFYLLAMAANLGLVLAQDLLTFYVFFVLLGFVAYALVVHGGSAGAQRAGRVYMLMLIAGEVCLFTAIALSALQLQDLRFSAMAVAPPSTLALGLFALGFGIKLGVPGLHVWLPLAHPAAPLPASAVLSGAIIKAGLLGWLRIAPPAGTLAEWSTAVIMLGLAGAFFGVLRGLTRRDPKAVLAYSSVSQMGLVTVLIGAGLVHPETHPQAAATALFAILLFTLHHGLAKGALFLGVGVIGSATPAQRPLALLTLVLPALALVGAPGSSGILAKLALSDTASAAGTHPVFTTLLYLSATATTVLMGHLFYLLRDAQGPQRAALGVASAARLWLPWLMLVLASLLIPWLWASGTPLVHGAWQPQALWSAVWPIVLGVLLLRGRRRAPVPGLLGLLPGHGVGWPWLSRQRRRRAQAHWQATLSVLSRLERGLHGWPVIGKLVLLLPLSLLLALRS